MKSKKEHKVFTHPILPDPIAVEDILLLDVDGLGGYEGPDGFLDSTVAIETEMIEKLEDITRPGIDFWLGLFLGLGSAITAGLLGWREVISVFQAVMFASLSLYCQYLSMMLYLSKRNHLMASFLYSKLFLSSELFFNILVEKLVEILPAAADSQGKLDQRLAVILEGTSAELIATQTRINDEAVEILYKISKANNHDEV